MEKEGKIKSAPFSNAVVIIISIYPQSFLVLFVRLQSYGGPFMIYFPYTLPSYLSKHVGFERILQFGTALMIHCNVIMKLWKVHQLINGNQTESTQGSITMLK